MKVLVLGTGAREHALVRALATDSEVEELHAAPGNAGIAAEATVHPLDLTDPPAAAALAAQLGVDLVVVGPEGPLVAGVADHLRAAGHRHASARAARRRSSRAARRSPRTSWRPRACPPRWRTSATPSTRSRRRSTQFGAPYVVKDDGLAAGKGVVVTDDRDAALAHARACLAKAGAASSSRSTSTVPRCRCSA